uniref:Uncharacterized protein n=1 Tax=Timema cristinae TaxID=61476 RepID=A0A7R9CKV6_TIMCR|nr:unnamed protein product [Timema cristinae]
MYALCTDFNEVDDAIWADDSERLSCPTLFVVDNVDTLKGVQTMCTHLDPLDFGGLRYVFAPEHLGKGLDLFPQTQADDKLERDS